MVNKKQKNKFISLLDYFNPTYFNTARHLAFTIGGSFAGYAVTGSLGNSLSFALSSYLLSLIIGPSKKSLKKFYAKHVNKDKFPDFKVPRKKFTSKSLLYGSLMSAAGVVAGSFVNKDIIDVIKQNGFDFSSFSPYQLDTVKHFLKSFALATPVLFSTGLFLGDSFNYVKNNMSFNNLLKSNFSSDSETRLELILSDAKKGIAGSNFQLISELYNQGRQNEALAFFFENYFVDEVSSDKVNTPLVSSIGLILDKKNIPLKFRLATALSESFPEPYIDGLINELILESENNNDVPALALSGFYLQNKKDPVAKSVWEAVGNQLNENQDSLESKLFARGTSEIRSINVSGNDVDLIQSTLLRKQSPITPNILSKLSDEKKLNNLAYTKYLNDESLEIPLLLHIGKTDKFAYSLLQLNRSDSLFKVAKKNPKLFDDLLIQFALQSEKIDSVFIDALNSNLVHFYEVDYASRIEDQKKMFEKQDFNHSLAKNLLERVESASQDIDFLKPSIDNLPEQWLYNLQKMVFSRLDFENKGLRRSMEDRINSVLWVYGSFPVEMISKSFDFQINEFCKQQNVDINVASKYFLDVLFERRNHLFNTWLQREQSRKFIPYLLNISDVASRRFGKFVDDKSYLSLQRQQNNSFYDIFKIRKRIFKQAV